MREKESVYTTGADGLEKLNGFRKPVETLIDLAEWMNKGAEKGHQKTVNDLEAKMGIAPNSCEYYVRVYDGYPTDNNPRAFLVARNTYVGQEAVLMGVAEIHGKMVLGALLRVPADRFDVDAHRLPVVAYIEHSDFGNPKTDKKRFTDFLVNYDELHTADAGAGAPYLAFSEVLSS